MSASPSLSINGQGGSLIRRRDWQTILLISIAHASSHFFQLVLPSLYVSLGSAFDLDFARLGLLVSVFYVVSGLGQASSGFLVDRIGARPVLWFGLSTFVLSGVLIGSATSYTMLLLAAAIGGAGNSVFHPVDFSLMNRRISQARLGHAFSTHGLSGNLGWALTPVFMTTLILLANWRVAAFGAAALVAVVLLMTIVWRHLLANDLPADLDPVATQAGTPDNKKATESAAHPVTAASASTSEVAAATTVTAAAPPAAAASAAAASAAVAQANTAPANTAPANSVPAAVARGRSTDVATGKTPPDHAPPGLMALLRNPALWAAFGFFMATSLALAAVQNYSIPLLQNLYALTPVAASGALSGYMLAAAGGMLAGGFLVSSRLNVERIVLIALILAGCTLVWLSAGGVPGVLAAPIVALAGFCAGVAGPSRDMLIRRVTPPGAMGSVYGLVYSGMDVGAAAAPLAFGLLLDRGVQSGPWLGAGVAFVVGAALAQLIARHARRLGR